MTLTPFIYWSTETARKNKSLNRLQKTLVEMISNDTFEFGFESRTEAFVREILLNNKSDTLQAISDVYLQNTKKPEVLMGLLHILSSMNYDDVYPSAPITILAAFSHSNVEVNEAAIRAFENWNNSDSLQYLENIVLSTDWLQDYLDEVINFIGE
jgi:tRNA G37 N-methylase Trm5